MNSRETCVERDGDACYFIDREGVRYRVYDVVYGKPTPHKKRVVSVEHPSANTRYFVRENGETRAYIFTKNEVRALEPERLARQLAGAGFIAMTPRVVAAIKPT